MTRVARRLLGSLRDRLIILRTTVAYWRP